MGSVKNATLVWKYKLTSYKLFYFEDIVEFDISSLFEINELFLLIWYNKLLRYGLLKSQFS